MRTPDDSWAPEIKARCHAVAQLLESRRWAAARTLAVECLRSLDLDPDQRDWFERAAAISESGQLTEQAETDVRGKEPSKETIQHALQRLERAAELDPGNTKAAHLRIEYELRSNRLIVEDLLRLVREDIDWIAKPENPGREPVEFKNRLAAAYGNLQRVEALDATAHVRPFFEMAEQIARLHCAKWPPAVRDPEILSRLNEAKRRWKERLTYSGSIVPEGQIGKFEAIVGWIVEQTEADEPSETLPPEIRDLQQSWENLVGTYVADLSARLDDYERAMGASPATSRLRQRLAESGRGEGPEELDAINSDLEALPPVPENRLDEVIARAQEWVDRPHPAQLAKQLELLRAELVLAEAGLAEAKADEKLRLERSLQSRLGQVQGAYAQWMENAAANCAGVRSEASKLINVREGPVVDELARTLEALSKLDPAADPDAFDRQVAETRTVLGEVKRRIGEAERRRLEQQERIAGELERLLQELIPVDVVDDAKAADYYRMLERLRGSGAAMTDEAIEQAQRAVENLQRLHQETRSELDRRFQRLSREAVGRLDDPDLPPALAGRLRTLTRSGDGDLRQLRDAVADLDQVFAGIDGQIERYRSARQSLASIRPEVDLALQDPWLEERVERPDLSAVHPDDRSAIDGAFGAAEAARDARRRLQGALAGVGDQDTSVLERSVDALRTTLKLARDSAAYSRELTEHLAAEARQRRSRLVHRIGGIERLPGLPLQDRHDLDRVRQVSEVPDDGSPSHLRRKAVQTSLARNELKILEQRYRARIEGLRADARKLVADWPRTGGLRWPRIREELLRKLQKARAELQEASDNTDADPGRLGDAIADARQRIGEIPWNLFWLAVGTAAAGLAGIAIAVNLVDRPVLVPYVPGYVASVYREGGQVNLCPTSLRCRLPAGFGRRYVAKWQQASADADGKLAGSAGRSNSNSSGFKVRPWPFPVGKVEIPETLPKHIDRMEELLDREGMALGR